MYAVFNAQTEQFIYDDAGEGTFNTMKEAQAAIFDEMDDNYPEEKIDVRQDYIIYELVNPKKVAASFSLEFHLETDE